MSAPSWARTPPLVARFRLSPRAARFLAVALAAAVAVASGFAVTGESLQALALVTIAVAGAVFVLAMTHRRALLAILLVNIIFLPIIPAFGGRGMSMLDVLMPVVLASTWIFGPRERIAHGGDPVVESRHRDLVRAGILYYVIALFSIALLAARSVPQALDTLAALSRSIQAAAFFYLIHRNVRSADGVRFVRNALLAGVLVAAAVNLPAVAFLGLVRAGAGIVVNNPNASLAAVSWDVGGMPIVITSPNELGSACVLVWALLLALPMRTRLRVFGFGLSLALLLATQSRSGLVSWAALLFVYGLRRGRRILLTLPFVGVGALTLLPDELKGRLVRTVLVEQGSWEAYSAIIRLFGWQTGLQVFLAHPLFGVGYMGFRFVAHEYNVLGLHMGTVENFFLETAVGMGVLGIVALGLIAITSWRLGTAARKHSEPGSLAHRLGDLTPAFLVSVALGNMTADNLIGLQNGAQFAIFLALLSRAASLPDCRVAAPMTR
jgi:O-antigen ligase